MFSTYKEAMDSFLTKSAAGIRFDLLRMTDLMERLGHPERKVKTIHVAGTNGKGSTVTFLRSILEEAGFFVGTFMSPVLGEPRQQVSINGNAMTEEEFTAVMAEISPHVQATEKAMREIVSEFELVTAAALYYFAFKKPVDMAVIETGMGGRNDATNVITPLAAVITNVTMEHKDFLGDTIEEIASEKAGIIKAGVPVMTAASGTAFDVIKKEAELNRAKLYPVDTVALTSEMKDGHQRLTYETPYRQLRDVRLGMAGDHQAVNAALALMVTDYLKQYYAVITADEQVISGLEKAKLPGRLEQVLAEPVIVVDTAHNPDAVEKAVVAVANLYVEKKIEVLFAAMKDKEVEQMLTTLSALAKSIHVTTFSSPRALSLDEYEAFAEGKQLKQVTDPLKWINDWQANRNADQVLLIVGSHYFVSEMRSAIVKRLPG
ncbi:dihydrofolate synthase / folylpolyglutamate synthase [Evansella caseinilytica]|uniref:tetrahydrofolate synthase n=1 Tax=Evansella caseinilytica TaxID=1503961 RepID=A0A1H3PU01_9BACI|nr:folylpolyglutamate synthase/dihydrofolate synthase family protein [Evansella caseinilytica]SDZ04428.1 dihydrofolate synthase / folylpolyglutamate synthase [Evansella caseinilytica]